MKAYNKRMEWQTKCNRCGAKCGPHSLLESIAAELAFREKFPDDRMKVIVCDSCFTYMELHYGPDIEWVEPIDVLEDEDEPDWGSRVG